MPLDVDYAMSTLKDIDDNALVRLVYVSRITWRSRSEAKLFSKIRKKASDNNKVRNITGVLCYGNGTFLQCLEGKKNKVVSLLKTIITDRRHKNIKVILIQTIESRSFNEWSMRLLFLERWLWTPTTKEKSDKLADFLPFKPYVWQPDFTEKFISVISGIETTPHIKTSKIRYDAFGNMALHVARPHQAFLFIQGLLTILVIIALILIYKLYG